MQNVLLFTDGSVNPQTKVGCGAYLLVTNPNPEINSLNVVLKCFEDSSSTKLELQTLLWALNEIHVHDRKIDVYTDSQNIIGLPDRRTKLEKNNFRSKTGKLLNNHELYQALFALMDQLNIEFHKVKGHMSGKQKEEIDKLFTLVDRASRKGLRERGI